MELQTIGPITLDSSNCTDLRRGQCDYQPTTMTQKANLNTCNPSSTACEFYDPSTTQQIETRQMETNRNYNNNNAIFEKIKYNYQASSTFSATNPSSPKLPLSIFHCTSNTRAPSITSTSPPPPPPPADNNSNNNLMNASKSSPILLTNNRLSELISNCYEQPTANLPVDCSNEQISLTNTENFSSNTLNSFVNNKINRSNQKDNEAIYYDHVSLNKYLNENKDSVQSTFLNLPTTTLPHSANITCSTSISSSSSNMIELFSTMKEPMKTNNISTLNNLQQSARKISSRTPSPSVLTAHELNNNTNNEQYLSSEIEHSKLSNSVENRIKYSTILNNEINFYNNTNQSSLNSQCKSEVNVNLSTNDSLLIIKSSSSSTSSSSLLSLISTSIPSVTPSISSTSSLYHLNSAINMNEPTCDRHDLYHNESIPIMPFACTTNTETVSTTTCSNLSSVDFPVCSTLPNSSCITTVNSMLPTLSTSITDHSSNSNNLCQMNKFNLYHLQNPYLLTSLESSKFSIQSHLGQFPVNPINFVTTCSTNVTFSTNTTNTVINTNTNSNNNNINGNNSGNSDDDDNDCVSGGGGHSDSNSVIQLYQQQSTGVLSRFPTPLTLMYETMNNKTSNMNNFPISPSAPTFPHHHNHHQNQNHHQHVHHPSHLQHQHHHPYQPPPPQQQHQLNRYHMNNPYLNNLPMKLSTFNLISSSSSSSSSPSITTTPPSSMFSSSLLLTTDTTIDTITTTTKPTVITDGTLTPTNLQSTYFPYSFVSNHMITNSNNNSINNVNNNLMDRINTVCDEYLPSDCRSSGGSKI
ncbi:unnamed protein product [Schistosoma margrebowiei]|uniref:Homeobox domain-containing protein n=1 Tax=Schistosoma margrebowiei TaxID=48269 RepID=A0AA85AD90_9TREM|nr:unnamed protein product [Schistosoma margrebowiei]